MKKAFTLVELLVVVAIIGVLAGVLMGTFSGGTESARAARCLSNMKNLASASQTYGMKTGHYPYAGSYLRMHLDTSKGRTQGKAKMSYTELPGWISWDSRGCKNQSAGTDVGLYSTNEDAARYALTNGCLWSYVSQNAQTYLCPSHVKKSGQTPPNWSYLMNGKAFGAGNSKPISTKTHVGQEYGSLARADRILLFSEVPFMGYSDWQPDGEGAGTDTDAVLKYNSSETIGANHTNGKLLLAHVVFADGHAEKLRIPYSGSIKKPKAEADQLKNLTQWLCEGKDLSFDGSQYQKMTN